MDIVKTASGMELETDYAVFLPMPPFAYIRIFNKSFVECASVFSDPEETKEITYGENTFKGYTNLMSIANEGDAIKVQLSR